jgi:hypothetical protein
MAGGRLRAKIAASPQEEVGKLLQWKPQVRVLFVVLLLLALALLLGWSNVATFLEW